MRQLFYHGHRRCRAPDDLSASGSFTMAIVLAFAADDSSGYGSSFTMGVVVAETPDDLSASGSFTMGRLWDGV